MDILRYVELAGTIKQGFGLPVQPKLVVVPKAENIIRMQPKIDFNSRRVMEEIRRRLDPNSPTKQTATVTIEVFESYRGVLVLFPADELFEPGTAKLRSSAGPLLDIVADQAAKKPNFDLLVEVRRSEDALRAPKYKDVWSLTTAQAVTINRYLRDKKGLQPGRVIAVGRGPAPPTAKPGTTRPPTQGSTVEFTLLSKVMKPK